MAALQSTAENADEEKKTQDAFFEIAKQWENSEPVFIDQSSMKGSPEFNYEMTSPVPHFTFKKKGRRTTFLYSIPLEFKEIISKPMRCSQCTYSYRSDDKIKEKANLATYLCIMNNCMTFRPVCDDCTNLSAFDYSICIEACIPFNEILNAPLDAEVPLAEGKLVSKYQGISLRL